MHLLYSYPHDEDKMSVDKYIDNCGFINLQRAKLAKQVHYVGMWNGKEKKTAKSLLANKVLIGCLREILVRIVLMDRFFLT